MKDINNQLKKQLDRIVYNTVHFKSNVSENEKKEKIMEKRKTEMEISSIENQNKLKIFDR
jgi:hypothetical protein